MIAELLDRRFVLAPLAQLHADLTGEGRERQVRDEPTVERPDELAAMMDEAMERVATARDAGRKPGVADTLIAATATAHGLPPYTCDHDFTGLAGIEVVLADTGA